MEKSCATCDRASLKGSEGRKMCSNCIHNPMAKAFPLSIQKTFKDKWRQDTDFEKLMEERQMTFDKMRGV